MFKCFRVLARPLRSLGNSESEMRLFLMMRWVRLVSWVPRDSGRKVSRLLLRSREARFPNCKTDSGKTSKILLHKTSFITSDVLKKSWQNKDRVRVKQRIRSPLMPTYFPLIFRLACYQQAGGMDQAAETESTLALVENVYVNLPTPTKIW